MTADEARREETAAETVVTEKPDLLQQAIEATPLTPPDRAKELVRAVVDEALKGQVTFDRNASVTLRKMIDDIERRISRQLAEVIHHEKFLRIEGSWRGLRHLVMNSETGTTLQIRMIHLTKGELYKDLTKASEFDQSQIYKKTYESEFGTPGGVPYAALIGDYTFTNHPEDIELLGLMSNVAAAGFAPFLTAADPKLLGLQSYTDLAKPRDLEGQFRQIDYAKWRSFRESPDSRFVALTLPRTLARWPYGDETKKVEAFRFEEVPLDSEERALRLPHEHFCWMNTAYVLGATITGAFAKTGFCMAIRGKQNGGKVEGLPSFVFLSEDGDRDQQCPTEIGIADRREAELGKCGFMPLSHWKNTDYAVFIGGQTAHKPQEYDRPEATANAAVAAKLPYVMATSRFAHCLKILGRDMLGSFMEATDCEKRLNRWINNYVNANPGASPEMKAQYPLAAAKVQVKEIPGKPGEYNAVVHLQPHMMLDKLTASMRLVARIPKQAT